MQTNHIYTLPDLEEMLEEVQKLTFAENPTFLEISGHASSENTFSNILKFFLDPKQPHGVGNLCLKSLLQSCERYNMPFINFESLHIEREHTTKTGRIDLLLLTSKWVIAIEN